MAKEAQIDVTMSTAASLAAIIGRSRRQIGRAHV